MPDQEIIFRSAKIICTGERRRARGDEHTLKHSSIHILHHHLVRSKLPATCLVVVERVRDLWFLIFMWHAWLQDHRPTLLENTELVADAFRAAGRYLCTHGLDFALEKQGTGRALRHWEQLFVLLQQPTALGSQRYKVHLQQHAAVITAALRRRDSGAPCDAEGRALSADRGPSSVNAAERPAGTASSGARARRKGRSRCGRKPQDTSQPMAQEEAAAAHARAQAAMDELLLEEVGGKDPM